MYLFTPVIIETSGVFGKQTLSFLKDRACCVRKVSGEVKSFPYLLQRLTVAVQRGNAASVLGTFASEDCLVFENGDAYSSIHYSMYVCIFLCLTLNHDLI